MVVTRISKREVRERSCLRMWRKESPPCCFRNIKILKMQVVLHSQEVPLLWFKQPHWGVISTQISAHIFLEQMDEFIHMQILVAHHYNLYYRQISISLADLTTQSLLFIIYPQINLYKHEIWHTEMLVKTVQFFLWKIVSFHCNPATPNY